MRLLDWLRGQPSPKPPKPDKMPPEVLAVAARLQEVQRFLLDEEARMLLREGRRHDHDRL